MLPGSGEPGSCGGGAAVRMSLDRQGRLVPGDFLELAIDKFCCGSFKVFLVGCAYAEEN